MKILRCAMVLALGLSLVISGASYAQETATDEKALTLLEALKGGTAAVNLRYRYEFVDQKGFDLNGHASTLRTALSYGTAAFKGFRVYLQAENVTNIGATDQHNDVGRGGRGNGVTGRPVIADPAGTDFLQAYVAWSGSGTQIELGRQEIVIDDARFVGNVGFRQHHQSFRAIRARNASLGKFKAQYAFVDRVYRIFGDRQETATHLINASYAFGPAATLTGYAYLLRYDTSAAQILSTDTFGAELKGLVALGDGDLRLRYEVEYAGQQDAGDNPRPISTSYFHGMAGIDVSRFGFRFGWERLGGSLADGQFSTPLATLHAFNGWADKFLRTPVNGLEDLYIRANGPAGPLAWVLVYHDFRAASGGDHYGTEFDFQVGYTAPWKQGFVFRGAIYSADQHATDTTKIWLMTTFAF